MSGRYDPRLLGAAATAVFCACAVVLAPGNAVRAAHFAHRHELWTTVTMSGLQTLRFLVGWCFDPAFLIASLLFIRFRRALVPEPVVHPWAPLTMAAIPILVILVAMVLPYWSTGVLGQYRTVNAALFVFLPFWCWTLMVWDDMVFRPKAWPVPLTGPRRLPLSIGVFLALMIFGRHDRDVTVELADGTLRRYDQEMTAWARMVRSAIASGDAEVRLPALTGPPAALDVLQPGQDADHWINKGMAQYFGKDDLRVVVVPLPGR